MDRKKFLKNALLSSAAMIGSNKLFKAGKIKLKNSTYDAFLKDSEFNTDQVGFNHLPNHEMKTMKTVLHKASSRGHADHGWLKSYHSFSFANYYNPERMNFGVLRVLNDDTVDAAKGFSTHPHDNMEIISIPLEGDLEHKDSMGNLAIIKEGDVQVMSAGTGVFHSEYNKNSDQNVKFLQIWLFPNKKNVQPRYDQISLKELMSEKNTFNQILSPDPNDQGVWIHQNAWFHIADLDKDVELNYELKNKQNGVYTFVIDGDVTIQGQELNSRDGFGIWDTDRFDIRSNSNSKILLMEVPMKL